MSRINKFNAEKLTNDQADKLGDKIGAHIRKTVDGTVSDLNGFLKQYGIRVKMQVVIEPVSKGKEQ